jgi:hypothetical protein
LFLDSECYWNPVARACPDLAYQRGGGRPVIPWGRGRSGGRGSCGLADPGGLEEACDYFHVSYFSVVLKSFSLSEPFFLLRHLVHCRAGAAVGAAATANAGGIVAAGGAALSAGAGAIASAASSFFGSVSGAGDGAASAAPSGGPRPHNSTGARPKRKVILVSQILQLFPP